MSSVGDMLSRYMETRWICKLLLQSISESVPVAQTNVHMSFPENSGQNHMLVLGAPTMDALALGLSLRHSVGWDPAFQLPCTLVGTVPEGKGRSCPCHQEGHADWPQLPGSVGIKWIERKILRFNFFWVVGRKSPLPGKTLPVHSIYSIRHSHHDKYFWKLVSVSPPHPALLPPLEQLPWDRMGPCLAVFSGPSQVPTGCLHFWLASCFLRSWKCWYSSSVRMWGMLLMLSGFPAPAHAGIGIASCPGTVVGVPSFKASPPTATVPCFKASAALSNSRPL